MLGIDIKKRKEKYKDFIDYACDRSDAVSLMTQKTCTLAGKRFIELLCNNMNTTVEEIKKQYMYNGFRNKVFNIYKEDHKNRNTWESKNLFFSQKEKDVFIKNKIETDLKLIEDLKQINEIEDKNRNRLESSIIIEKHNKKWISSEVWSSNFGDSSNEPQYNGEYYFNNAFYKITDEVIEFLKRYNNLVDFISPQPEDLTFYKNGYAWYFQVSHEGYAGIEIKNHEEYKFLREIFGQSLDEEKESEYINYERREDLYQDYIKYMK